MPTTQSKMDDLVEWLEVAAGHDATVEKTGAHGVTVTSHKLSGDVLSVGDQGPNGATVVDVRHSYDGYGQPTAVVVVGWA